MGSLYPLDYPQEADISDDSLSSSSSTESEPSDAEEAQEQHYHDYSYIGHDEQKRMFYEFQAKIKKEKVVHESRKKITRELIDGDIYIVFHFPDHQGSNEDKIVPYDNAESIRVCIYRYQKKHPLVFFYSTNRDDLVVDPAKDPTKHKPKLGSCLPPYPNNPQSNAYRTKRYSWQNKFNKRLLKAVDKGGKSLGIIYFRWYHIDNPKYSLKHSDLEQRFNTAAVRRELENEHVRHPYDFFYSSDPNNLDVDPNNPNKPPTLGALFPEDYQPPEGTRRSSSSDLISVALGSPPLILHSPDTSRAPIQSAYSGPSVPWDGSAMPELIAPTTPLTTTMAVTPSATLSIDHTQHDLMTRAMIEANLSLNKSNAENPENQMEEDRHGSGNGISGMATIVLAPTTSPTEENEQDIPQYLITFYPSEVGNDAIFTTPFTASLPASLHYMLGSSTDPGMEPVVPTTITGGIHPSSFSFQEPHSLDDEMEISSESDIESLSDEENVEVAEDFNQYNVSSDDLHNVQQQAEVEDVEMMELLDDVIGLEEDFGVANDGVIPNEKQILADLHNIAAQEGDAERLGNALMMGMMGADYNPYVFPPEHEEGEG